MRNRFDGVDLGTSNSIKRIVNSQKRRINELLDELIVLVEPISKEAADILRSQKEDLIP